MGNRLSKISTRTGDSGETGLGDGSRLPKHHTRIRCIGEVDELNSAIGLVIAHLSAADLLVEPLSPLLKRVQHDLFDIGGELAVPGMAALKDSMLTELEAAQDTLNADLPPLKDFILPGGNLPAAQCHMARAICRRAERSLAELIASELGTPELNASGPSSTLSKQAGSATRDPALSILTELALPYLNRLSDTLFICARLLARTTDDEVLWQSRYR